METSELLSIIANGEDSQHQFKANVTHAESLAQEMIAFSNAQGGQILIGVNDDATGSLFGLTRKDVDRINQLISNAAANNVRPAINPSTENIALPDGMVIVVNIEAGLNKPYSDNAGNFWVKSGADKRKVTAREELQRLFQQSGLLHADVTPVVGTSIADVDIEFFDRFYSANFEAVDKQPLSRTQLLENMNLMQNGQLTYCGALLFAKKPELRLPAFIVKAVAFPGVMITDQHYIDSQDITGRLADIFQKTLGFILANIHHVQNAREFNSLGEPEIPRIVLEELLANALIHRDYFISAPVRVLIFADRIEIISPGHLPNNLTVDNIKYGNSNMRNPVLASYATKILPYRGVGSGVPRALLAYPDIDLIDERDGNLFKVIIKRHS